MSFDLELLKVPYNIAEALIPREDVQGELYMNYGVWKAFREERKRAGDGDMPLVEHGAQPREKAPEGPSDSLANYMKPERVLNGIRILPFMLAAQAWDADKPFTPLPAARRGDEGQAVPPSVTYEKGYWFRPGDDGQEESFWGDRDRKGDEERGRLRSSSEVPDAVPSSSAVAFRTSEPRLSLRARKPAYPLNLNTLIGARGGPPLAQSMVARGLKSASDSTPPRKKKKTNPKPPPVHKAPARKRAEA